MDDGHKESFLVCTSTTNGVFVYQEDSFQYNEGVINPIQKYFKLRGYARYNHNEVGFTAEEIHPINGLLAT